MGKVEQLLADRGRNVLECRFRQLEGLQVGPHHVRDSAYFGSGPQVVHRRFLEASALPKSFQCDIHADLVAEFEAVRNCLRRGVDLEGRAGNGIFLHSEMESCAGHPHEANWWRGYAWSPRFHIDGHPNVMWGLCCELVELKRGEQAKHALWDLMRGFDERQMLGNVG